LTRASHRLALHLRGGVKIFMEFWLALAKQVRMLMAGWLAKAELASRAMQPVVHRPVSENRPARAKRVRLGLAVLV